MFVSSYFFLLHCRYGGLSDDLVEDILIPLHKATVVWMKAVCRAYKSLRPAVVVLPMIDNLF